MQEMYCMHLARKNSLFIVVFFNLQKPIAYFLSLYRLIIPKKLCTRVAPSVPHLTTDLKAPGSALTVGNIYYVTF